MCNTHCVCKKHVSHKTCFIYDYYPLIKIIKINFETKLKFNFKNQFLPETTFFIFIDGMKIESFIFNNFTYAISPKKDSHFITFFRLRKLMISFRRIFI